MKGFGGAGGGMGNMLRQAQKQAQDMQRRMADLQQDLKQRVYDGVAGGGMVTVHVNGQREILAVKINPEVVDPKDVEILEDMIKVAVGLALKKAEQAYADEMGKLTGGIGIPGLF
jgi:nucleoid-associated protein EbfC